MPEMKRNFTKGKMNKDLDERLVPNGEYRDAMNIQVSTSEGSDVGTIQNVLGNTPGCVQETYTEGYLNPIPVGSTTVGSVSDEKNDTLYWLVAGPNNINDYLPLLNFGDMVTLKDMIMRINSSTNTGCEPVFVDKHGWCVNSGVNTSTQTNSIVFDNTDWYDNVTAGMYVMGYDGTNPQFPSPVLVNNVGGLNNIQPVHYSQGATSQSVIQPTITQDVSLRVFDNYLCGGGLNVPFTFEDYTPCINYGGAQENLPPNGSSQIFFPGVAIQNGIVVGATLSNSPYYTNGSTITHIYTGMICPLPGPAGCALHTILTIDTVPTASPPFNNNNLGGLPFDNEAGFSIFSVDITAPPVITYIPNNVVNIQPISDQWLN